MAVQEIPRISLRKYLDILVDQVTCVGAEHETIGIIQRTIVDVYGIAKPADNPQQLLTEFEAGELLRLPTMRVVKLAKAGNLPSVKLPGDEFRFIETELWAWAEQHRISAPEGS